MLTHCEEMLLLTIHDERGAYRRDSLENDFYLVSAATLYDLAIRQLVFLNDSDDVVPSKPWTTGHAILDSVFNQIISPQNRYSLISWINDLTESNNFKNEFLHHMIEKEIIAQDCQKLFGLFPFSTYPAKNMSVGHELRNRLKRAVNENQIVDERTVALLTLIRPTPVIRILFPEDTNIVSERVRQWSRHNGHDPRATRFLHSAAEAISFWYA
jgi:hypothetical protein